MELKLARTELNKEAKTITLDEIAAKIEKSNTEIFYFDRENSHKTMVGLMDYFEDLGKSVYFREVRYGFDEEEYVYEIHIL